MLELQGVEVFYGNIRALKSIFLQVNEGEIVALLGANGAGKTTTLMAISGLLRVRSGKIIFNGNEIQGTAPDRIVEMGICQVPEGRRVYPRLSVMDNLRVGAITKRNPEHIARNLELVYWLFPRLKERSKQQAGTLSGGEQQMLAIGRALMAGPKLLLLDEPSLGIAPKLAEQIFETLKSINKSGTTILLVEQNAPAALSLAHRGYIMQTGEVVLQGTSQELESNREVRKAYLGG